MKEKKWGSNDSRIKFRPNKLWAQDVRPIYKVPAKVKKLPEIEMSGVNITTLVPNGKTKPKGYYK
jgi:hypothetical protein